MNRFVGLGFQQLPEQDGYFLITTHHGQKVIRVEIQAEAQHDADAEIVTILIKVSEGFWFANQDAAVAIDMTTVG